MIFSVNETLDDMLEDSGDEEETNAIVGKVLDEIGIEISGKVIYSASVEADDFIAYAIALFCRCLMRRRPSATLSDRNRRCQRRRLRLSWRNFGRPNAFFQREFAVPSERTHITAK